MHPPTTIFWFPTGPHHKSKAESHLDLWVRLWSDPHHSLVININFNNLQISSYRVLRLQATRVSVSVCFLCAAEITEVMWASVRSDNGCVFYFYQTAEPSTFNSEPHTMTLSLLPVCVPIFLPDLWHNWDNNLHNYLSQCDTHFSDFITNSNLQICFFLNG